MTDQAGVKSPWRLTIAVQIVLLLLSTLLVTQVVTLCIVLFMPPPTAPVYTVYELADALNGGPLRNPSDGGLLRREVKAEPPEAGDHRPSSLYFRHALAQALHAPEARVRFETYRRPPPGFVVLALPGVVRQPVIEARSASMRPGPPPAFGNFKAAYQQADGRWAEVGPATILFPNEWQKRVIIWFLICLSILAPIGYLFARRVTGAIARFAEAAQRLGRDPTAPLMELEGPAEISVMTAAFNEMQVQLKRYVDHRTQMMAAISHDLRTPLTRIRFKAEGAPPEVKAAIFRDIDQMEEMIGGVLAFVRDATEARRRLRSMLDVLSVAECVVDGAALTGGDVKITSGQPLVVEADALGVERVLGNLIDNAVKYAGRVRVRVRRDGAWAVIDVKDNGPGIPASDLERVFDAFHRVESSRSPETGGIGLGLTVARSIARAHGGGRGAELRSRGAHRLPASAAGAGRIPADGGERAPRGRGRRGCGAHGRQPAGLSAPRVSRPSGGCG
ncbi:MAG: HAMP domain-containing sensor histidine kinase [Caulobacteraceae bacterium]